MRWHLLIPPIRANLHILPVTSGVSARANDVKPFEALPTVPGPSYPIFGQGFQIVGKTGLGQTFKQLAKLKKEFVPPDINLLRVKIPYMNRENDGRVVFVFDPEDMEIVYRNEGKYPMRGQSLEVLGLLRKRRPDIFGETVGVLMEEGEEWLKIRQLVQQDMMRPKSAHFYISGVKKLADDFVEYVRRNRQPDLTNSGDFLRDCQNFGFEAISLIALDHEMGGFRPNPNVEVKKMLDLNYRFVEIFPKLVFGLPTWKYFPPRWSKTYREAEDLVSTYIDFIRDRVFEAAERIKNKMEKSRDMENAEESTTGEISVLEKLICKCDPESTVPTVMAFDMVVAGIDTTGNTLGFLLYNLAKHPEVQERLREEVMNDLSEIPTPTQLGKMRYYRACLRESFRTHPTAMGLIRVIPQDITLKNHLIPKGTLLISSAKVIGQDETRFPDSNRYDPSRWLSSSSDSHPHPVIHPFAVRQFSHGPRMCVGKRFAEMELQLAVAQILRNFRLEWVGDGEIEILQKLTNMPDRALKFKFVDL